MQTKLTRAERRAVLVLLDHQTSTDLGRCSCGFTCDPGSAYTLAVHVAAHLTDTPLEESGPLCPECIQGKHTNCAGQALDPDTDEFVPCSCRHGHGQDASSQ